MKPDGSPQLIMSLMKREHCAHAKDVWLFVKDANLNISSKFQSLLDNSPICTQIISTSSWEPTEEQKRRPGFWEVKMVSLRDYLMKKRDIKTILVTDIDDIHMNPMTSEELMARFSKQLTWRKRLLLSFETNCWNGVWNQGPHCSQERGLEIADALLPHFPKLNGFPHSMYMGERDAVIDMLSFSLNMTSDRIGFPSMRITCDQDMIQKYAMQYPHKVAIDVDEEVFGNLNRHYKVNNDAEGYMSTCLKGGKVGKCFADKNDLDFNCTKSADGTRIIRDGGKTVASFVIHASGAAEAVCSPSCHETFTDIFSKLRSSQIEEIETL